MTIFDCVSMPAVAYTLMSQVKIQINPVGYLSDYIVASLFIIFLSFVLLTLMKTIKKNVKNLNKFKILNSIVSNDYKQLEQNIGSL